MESQFKFYIVGGYVRDKLLGIKSKDMDYVVVTTLIDKNINVIYELFCDYLTKNNYLIFLKTPECYTVRAKNKLTNETDDFVLARKEIGYHKNSRKPLVVPGSLLDDLARRDFTINAMAMDPETNDIIDPFNGRLHLEEKKLKTPLDPNITLLDDPLRVIRGLRFSIILGFTLTNQFMIAIANPEIWDKFKKVVSTERVRDELEKMFRANTIATLELLNSLKTIHNDACQIILNHIVLKPIVIY